MKYIVYPVFFEYAEYEGRQWATDGGYAPVAIVDTEEEADLLVERLMIDDIIFLEDEVESYLHDGDRSNVLDEIFGAERSGLFDHYPGSDMVTDRQKRLIYNFLSENRPLYSFWTLE